MPQEDAAFGAAVSLRIAGCHVRGHAPVPDHWPPELKILDAALEVECSQQEEEVTQLEAEGRAALEALAKDVSSASMERVRRLKSSCSSALASATGLRSELKRFLDDDSNMRSLQLTKLEQGDRGSAGDADVQLVEDVLEAGYIQARRVWCDTICNTNGNLTRGFVKQVDSLHRRLSLLSVSSAPLTCVQTRSFQRLTGIVRSL